uniref:Si:ch73-335m24.2 n=1 Tax=Kryptolebias marmoratus TaxID=37003 RepID=A0A3Q2ZAT9_KRYMA
MCCFLRASPCVSVYLHSILRNHTAHACEGEMLIIKCPSRTSVSVLSAFYGRRVPYKYLCPSANANATTEDTECTSSVALEKVLSECQDQQSCHIPVLTPVFGPDPCPLTTKYLLVSYKCRPGKPLSNKTKSAKLLVCENERLRLACKNETVLAIYSATFGHLNTLTLTKFMYLFSWSLKVSRRCHGRANCSVLADTQTFGDPCFPGTRKHLRVSFTCVPRYLLEDVGRGSTDPFLISDYTHGKTSKDFSTRLVGFSRPQNVFVTNSLEMIEKMLGLPERVALYFVSGICAGLVFLLCLFGLRSTLVRDVKGLISDLNDELKAARRKKKELMDDLFDQEVSDTSSFRRLTQSYRTADVFSPAALTVELVERDVQQTRDLSNGDIWPQLDSSPYAIHKIITYNN